SDKLREPVSMLALTFGLGAVGAGAAIQIESWASAWTGLDARVSPSGHAGSILFVFALVAPIREAAKVAATWPPFRTAPFDAPSAGIVYASMAALGFCPVENAVLLHDPPEGIAWIARSLLAFPAHLFFASAWGYSLGRAKQSKRPGSLFPFAWAVATASHGLY